MLSKNLRQCPCLQPGRLSGLQVVRSPSFPGLFPGGRGEESFPLKGQLAPPRALGLRVQAQDPTAQSTNHTERVYVKFTTWAHQARTNN